jgi:uncharacterized protein YuzE
MRFEYDPVRDLLYIRFAGAVSRVARTETVVPGVHADFGVDDKLLGIEVLDASELMGGSVEFQVPQLKRKVAG